MLSVVTWRWKPRDGYRSTFGPDTVNVLRRMVARHYQAPHRFICVTDDPAGLDPGIEVLPLWEDFGELPNPQGAKYPSCYRRLRLFHPDAAVWFGERFVSLDLDCVVTGNLRPLWDRPEDIVLWGDTHPTTPYNGSMVLLRAGARPRVWTEFDPATSPQRAQAAHCFGSDQGWISYVLGPREPRWSYADGVYSFRLHLRSHRQSLPGNARIVIFHGRQDPWQEQVRQGYAWVREHYR